MSREESKQVVICQNFTHQKFAMGNSPKFSSAKHLRYMVQARSHWLGWSRFNLTTFIKLYNIDLVNSVTTKTTSTIL